MRALVTGVAGFIGSSLADRLLDDGWSVRGVDALTDYYDPAAKRSNLQKASVSDRFELVIADLLTTDLRSLLDGVDVVFHQAGQPGVRLSWADGFQSYVDLNVVVTQRLLEAVRATSVGRLVFASSSSVYGDAATYPTSETDPTVPQSPYGVTKLAAELLCRAYAANFDIPTVCLRYFTVYGPRQRPDMAIHRLIEAAMRGTSFQMFGDGHQERDFTFVDDVVDANALAGVADVAPGTVINVAGGGSISMRDLVDLVERTVGAKVNLERKPASPGDVMRTGGNVDRALQLLHWKPNTSIEDGVRAQVDWHAVAQPTSSGLEPRP